MSAFAGAGRRRWGWVSSTKTQDRWYAPDVSEGDSPNPWYALLDKLPPGLDETQIEENLKLTPTERVEKMRRFLEALEDWKRHGHGLRPDHAGP